MAECGDIVSETFVIEDCWQIISSPYSKGFNTELCSPPVEITGNVVKNGTWGGTRIYGYTNETLDRVFVFLSNNSANTSEGEKIRYNVGTSWVSFKIIIRDGSVSLWIDNSLVNTVSVDTSGYVNVNGGSNSNPVSISNLKIKPL